MSRKVIHEQTYELEYTTLEELVEELTRINSAAYALQVPLNADFRVSYGTSPYKVERVVFSWSTDE